MGRPLSLDGVSTYPLASRKSKVSRAAFARPHRRGAPFAAFLDGLPRILAGETLRALRDEVLRARARRRPVIWGLGAHVIKVGLAPVLIDLMERGFVTAIAMNGAGIVHDFEVAVAGRTSEDVEAGPRHGRLRHGARDRRGGEPRDRRGGPRRPRPRGRGGPLPLDPPARARAPRREPARRGVAARPARDRPRRDRHRHRARAPRLRPRAPSAAPPTSTSGSFAGEVARLGGGGVYLNVGSAVVLPEVFLKAVTLARNLGHRLADFATANLDFLQSYRPGTNVVERPVKGTGRGYRLTGHHEILVPLLAAALVEKDGGRGRRR